ncbi:hypothetical protein MPSEU_000153700 [Mayamaea pseudoterrestris]|nr:hypothetical protein MPSEU_000153700 [Mayamaea pseudoterrestris]
MKGIELEIPPDVAASLRRRQAQPQEADDAWNQIIPLHPTGLPLPVDDSNSTAAFSPPNSYGAEETVAALPYPLPISAVTASSTPVIVIDIVKLQGFPASSIVEIAQLKQQLHEAFQCDECPSRTFIRTARELFELGVAGHGEKDISNGIHAALKSVSDTLHQIIMDYPQQFTVEPDDALNAAADTVGAAEEVDDGDDDGQDSQVPSLMTTQVLWNVVASAHAIPIVDRLFQLLRKCHRDIVWKYQLRTLLQDWVQHRQLIEWKTRRRQAQLNQLYQVRQAFDLRIGMAEQKVEKYEQQRDELVKVALQQRRLADIMGVGGGLDDSSVVEAEQPLSSLLLTWTSNEAEVEDDQQALLSDSSAHNCSSSSSSDDQTNFLSDDEVNQGMGMQQYVTTATAATFQQEAIDTVSLRVEKRRERRKVKQYNRELDRLEQRRSAAEQFTNERESVRESLTSNEHKGTLAIIASLRDKVEHVDELIESLQEEQWQDEEEGEANETIGHERENDAIDIGGQLTLLDQILCMILSSMGEAEHDDYFRQRDEHLAIKTGWFEYFGALLDITKASEDSFSTRNVVDSIKEQQQTLRAGLGITECAWDDEENEESTANEVRKVGLRPGGCVL